jgi:hypothetical protein
VGTRLLDDLAQVMADASICGLGQAAPNPVRCVHKYFPHEVGEDAWPGDLPKPRNSPLAEQLPPERAMSALDPTPAPAWPSSWTASPSPPAPGETILAAQRHGVEIPHLCYSDGLRPDGNCRACVVEIAGERTLAPSCCRTPTPGMKVQAASPRARKSQQMVLEMLLSTCPMGYKRRKKILLN